MVETFIHPSSSVIHREKFENFTFLASKCDVRSCQVNGIPFATSLLIRKKLTVNVAGLLGLEKPLRKKRFNTRRLMVMKKSICLALGLIFTSLLGACSDEPVDDAAADKTAKQSDDIFNGRAVKAKEFKKKYPWTMTLLIREKSGELSSCTGILIDAEWVLTAEHCTKNAVNVKVNDDLVLPGLETGSVNFNDFEFDSKRIINHPRAIEASGSDARYDVSLVQLSKSSKSKPLAFVKTVKEESDIAPADTVLTILGWGDTNPSEDVYKPLDRLQIATMTIASREGCSQIPNFDTTELCAVQEPSQGSIGGGDSGGPAIVWSPKRQENVLVGVSSWSTERTTNNNFAGFARMAVLGRWITQNIR